MRKAIYISVGFLFTLFCSHQTSAQSAFDTMTNEKMQKILYREAQNVQGNLGNWQFEYKEVKLMIITDENYNRMRIIAPIAKKEEVSTEEMVVLLEANFDKALDAKYSIYQDVLWSTFTHPLAELTVEQFKDAMGQVARLYQTYGSSYTSTDFTFGSGEKKN